MTVIQSCCHALSQTKVARSGECRDRTVKDETNQMLEIIIENQTRAPDLKYYQIKL